MMHTSGCEPSPERRFIEQFEGDRRGPIANLFLRAYREEGLTDPAEIIRFVRADLNRRCAKWAMRQDTYWLRYFQQLRDEVNGALNADPNGALAYVRALIDRERRPAEEKLAERQERSAYYRARTLAAQPPTEKQICYLKALGYAGPDPENKAAASRAIDALLQAKGGAR